VVQSSWLSSNSIEIDDQTTIKHLDIFLKKKNRKVGYKHPKQIEWLTGPPNLWEWPKQPYPANWVVVQPAT
jgi:hypothetical protein